MIVNKKIHSMFVRNLMSMEFDKESELGLKRNSCISKSYLQGILIHIFIQPRSHLSVHLLTAAQYGIHVAFKLHKKFWINLFFANLYSHYI